MTSHIIKILFMIQLSLSLCAHDTTETTPAEEVMPILVKMGSAFSMPDTKIDKAIFEFAEIDLVAFVEKQHDCSSILFFNYDETNYLGALTLHGSIYSLSFKKNRLVIKLLSKLGSERLEYIIVRHTELLTAEQKKLIKKVASKIEWAILMGERARALLPYDKYQIIESMPLTIRTQMLPFVRKQWIWQKMPSCLF